MKLTVVMVNIQRTRIAIVHENSYMPYTYRTVQVELTEEQMSAIRPRKTGFERGEDVWEERGNVWLEE